MIEEEIRNQIISKWEYGGGVSDIAEQMGLAYAIVFKVVMEHIEKIQAQE